MKDSLLAQTCGEKNKAVQRVNGLTIPPVFCLHFSNKTVRLVEAKLGKGPELQIRVLAQPAQGVNSAALHVEAKEDFALIARRFRVVQYKVDVNGVDVLVIALVRDKVHQPDLSGFGIGQDAFMVKTDGLFGRKISTGPDEAILLFCLIPDPIVDPGIDKQFLREGLIRLDTREDRLRRVEQRLRPMKERSRFHYVRHGDTVRTAEYASVGELVGNCDAAVTSLGLAHGLIRDHSAMEVRCLDNPRGVLEFGNFTGGPETDEFHIIGRGDALFISGEIELKGPYKKYDHRAGYGEAAPSAAKNLQCLLDEHLGGKVPDKGTNEHHHQHEQRRRQAAQLTVVKVDEQQIGKDQSRTETETVFEHRLEDLDRHHVACGFHSAAAVEQQRSCGQKQTGNAVSGQNAESVEPVAIGLEPGSSELFHEQNRRREEKKLRASAVHAEDEERQELACAALGSGNREVQHSIDRREHQKIPGEHGAEDRKAVKSDVAHRSKRQEVQQCGEVQQTARAEKQCRDHRSEQVIQKQRDEPSKPSCQEHGLPTNRKAVHHATALALVEIVEHGHGCDHTTKSRKVYDRDALMHGSEIHARHSFLKAGKLCADATEVRGLRREIAR